MNENNFINNLKNAMYPRDMAQSINQSMKITLFTIKNNIYPPDLD